MYDLDFSQLLQGMKSTRTCRPALVFRDRNSVPEYIPLRTGIKLRQLTWVQDLTGNSEISMVVESIMATSPLFMNWFSITFSIVPLKPL